MSLCHRVCRDVSLCHHRTSALNTLIHQPTHHCDTPPCICDLELCTYHCVVTSSIVSSCRDVVDGIVSSSLPRSPCARAHVCLCSKLGLREPALASASTPGVMYSHIHVQQPPRWCAQHRSSRAVCRCSQATLRGPCAGIRGHH